MAASRTGWLISTIASAASTRCHGSSEASKARSFGAPASAFPPRWRSAMVRESLDANARHIMVLVFPSNAARNDNDGRYEFQSRTTTGGGATAICPPQPQPRVSYPDTWLRLRREGQSFIAFSSSDGFSWREYARTTLALPAQIYFGLAVTAHTASTTTPSTTAKFHGDTRRQPWYYPSRQDCVSCHTPQSGGVLGLSTRQLTRDLLFHSGFTDNQLRTWNHVGYFQNGPTEAKIPALEKLAHHSDGTATLEKRTSSLWTQIARAVTGPAARRPFGTRAMKRRCSSRVSSMAPCKTISARLVPASWSRRICSSRSSTGGPASSAQIRCRHLRATSWIRTALPCSPRGSNRSSQRA